MKAEQAREMSVEELQGKEKELAESLFRLRFQKSLGQLDNALKIRETRRDLARVKTVIRQKAAPAAAKSRHPRAGKTAKGSPRLPFARCRVTISIRDAIATGPSPGDARGGSSPSRPRSSRCRPAAPSRRR